MKQQNKNHRIYRKITDSYTNALKNMSFNEVFLLLFELQEKLMLRSELQYFNNDENWLAAQKVLEIGFGENRPIGSQEKLFPDKNFEYINFNFLDHSDITTLTKSNFKFPSPKYDYIILRFVAQQFANPLPLLKNLKSKLKKNGSILFIDARDNLKKYTPSIPEVEKLYKAVAAGYKESGRNRLGIELVSDKARYAGLKIAKSELSPLAAISRDEKYEHAQAFMLATVIFEKMVGLKTNEEKLAEEFTQWMNNPISYGQMVLQFLLLKR